MPQRVHHSDVYSEPVDRPQLCKSCKPRRCTGLPEQAQGVQQNGQKDLSKEFGQLTRPLSATVLFAVYHMSCTVLI